MLSAVKEMNKTTLPLVEGEYSMIPFDLETLKGLSDEFKDIAGKLLKQLPKLNGTAYLTVHGKILKKGETLRRPLPHIDGNYEPHYMTYGGGGWKVGESGRPVGHPIHERQYAKETGGIILCSNEYACNGWVGEFNNIPEKGGDCSHFDLGEGFKLKPNTVYYGNNHFIHESLPMERDVHRVFARITLPENHIFVTEA